MKAARRGGATPDRSAPHMSQKTYRIGEAAAKLNLKSYVLRFWETEFSQIAPIRTEKGQRLYTESDLAVLSRIRFLLHERGLTIDGARRLLREEAAKGTLYTAAGILPPDDLPDEETYEPEEEDAGAAPATGGPVQASLFAPADASGIQALSPVLSEEELRAIVAELASIHHLLVFEASGDTQ